MAPLDTKWKQLLWNCYTKGKKTYKDDGDEILEILGNYVFLERPQDIFIPGRVKVDDPERFLDLLDKGSYDIQGYPFKTEALYDYVTSLNDDKHIFCSDSDEYIALFSSEKPCDDNIVASCDSKPLFTPPFIYTYPERLLHQFNVVDFDVETKSNEFGYLNQYDVILNRLRTSSGSNRAVATLYQPGLDRERNDIPCLNWLQATIREGNLELHVMFRSNDLYGAWPANMYFITYLGLCLAKDLNVSFNGIHYHSSSLHIYKNNLDAVKKILDTV